VTHDANFVQSHFLAWKGLPALNYFLHNDGSCVPLHNFDYVYDFLMGSKHSFLDWWVLVLFLRFFTFLSVTSLSRLLQSTSLHQKLFVFFLNWCATNLNFTALNFPSFDDPGPHGVFRYSKNMLPEVRETEFRKGSQVSLSFLMQVHILWFVMVPRKMMLRIK
jgi:hypothetical protein